MYIYYCDKCQKLEAFESKSGFFNCTNCGQEYLALGITVDEWNNYSNDEMLSAIEAAKKPIIRSPFGMDKSGESPERRIDIDENNSISEDLEKEALIQRAMIEVSANPSKEAEFRRLQEKNNSRPGVKCPYCGSSSCSRLGLMNKSASIAFWGIASRKIGKQWKCNSCKSMF